MADKEMKMSDIPRRADMLRWSEAELAISSAMGKVENMPADPILTEAVMLLTDAQNKVADYVDNHPEFVVSGK